MKELTISPAAGQNFTEVVVREGQALPLEIPKKLDRVGTIEAPAEYLRLRNDGVPRDKSHIIVSRETGTIVLFVMEQSDRGVEISGTMVPNPVLTVFGINSDKMFKLNDLKKIVLMNKHHFVGRNNSALLEALEKFEYERIIKGKMVADKRGNIDQQYKQELANAVPLSFQLDLSLFSGGVKAVIDVEIGVDVRDFNDINFYFFSPDLEMKKRDHIDEAIKTEIAKMPKDILIIYSND